MQIFISSAECYQPVIVIKKRGSQIDHNKRLPLYMRIQISPHRNGCKNVLQ